jgi:putative hydrolase of the HAD superfamily
MILRAVLFDMDDTLVDWSARYENWDDITRQHLLPMHTYLRRRTKQAPSVDTLMMAYHEQSRRAWESLSEPGWNCPSFIDILRHTLLALDIPPGSVDLEAMQRRFRWGAIPGVALYGDSLSTLKFLRRAGLKTGLITNAAVPMWMRDRELKTLGLLRHLDVRLTAGDVGKIKPHPRPFKTALKRLGVKSSEAVFIGDRVYDDVAGAQSVGMKGIWLRRGAERNMTDIQPDAIIKSLSDLPLILEDWYPGWQAQKALRINHRPSLQTRLENLLER